MRKRFSKSESSNLCAIEVKISSGRGTEEACRRRPPSDTAVSLLETALHAIVRLVRGLVACLWVPVDIVQGIWNLPAEIRACRLLQDALRQQVQQFQERSLEPGLDEFDWEDRC